jgi:Uma2 family endonuclease
MTTTAERSTWTLEDLATQFGPVELHGPVSKDAFVAMASRHPNVRMEREPNGTVTLISPIKKGSSRRENQLSFLLNYWNYQVGKGEVFGPNGSFDLPDGAIKMPDVSWIAPERMNDSGGEEEYIQVVPDFVAEIRSATDRLQKLQQKMTDTWIANGVHLAWLIDPYEEKVWIYRLGASEPEVVEGFSGKSLSGEEIMSGFELPLDTMKRR